MPAEKERDCLGSSLYLGIMKTEASGLTPASHRSFTLKTSGSLHMYREYTPENRLGCLAVEGSLSVWSLGKLALAREPWSQVWVSALSLRCSMTLGRLLPPWGSRLPHLYSEGAANIQLQGPISFHVSVISRKGRPTTFLSK